MNRTAATRIVPGPARFEPADNDDRWTPKLVEARMVEAFDTLRRMGRTPGPGRIGTNWPSELRDIAGENAEAPTRTRVITRPSGHAIARMDEALAWPLTYLSAHPIFADALNVWAYAKATGANLTMMLQYRAAEAAKRARLIESALNADIEKLRRHEAASVATWAAKRRFLSDGSREALERIRGNARIRMERACQDLMPVFVKPADVEPDRALSRTALDRNRFAASTLIAERLIRRGLSISKA